jgi:hypothetical protein
MSPTRFLGAAAAAALPLAAAACIFSASVLMPESSGGQGGDMPSAGSVGAGGGMTSASASGMSSSGGCTPTDCYEDANGEPLLGLNATTDGVGSCIAGSKGCGSTVCMGAVGPTQQDTACGPDGDDDNCDGVMGNCDTLTIYVGIPDATVCVAATDAFISDNLQELTDKSFTLISQFKAFAKTHPNTIELTRCTFAGGKNRATLGTTADCTPSSPDYRRLGFVSTKSSPGYEQLRRLTLSTGGITSIAVENSMYSDVCCHASCSFLDAYVPTK